MIDEIDVGMALVIVPRSAWTSASATPLSTIAVAAAFRSANRVSTLDGLE